MQRNRWANWVIWLISLPICLQAQVPFSVIDQALESIRLEQGWHPAMTADIQITDNYVTSHNGVGHVYLRQRYEGIEIEQATIMMVFDKRLSLVRYHETFVHGLDKPGIVTKPKVSASEAIMSAAAYHHIPLPRELQPAKQTDRPDLQQWFPAWDALAEAPMVVLSFYETATEPLRLAWMVRLHTADHQHWWNTWIDAQTLEVLHEVDWVVHCQFHQTDEYAAPPQEVKAFGWPAFSPQVPIHSQQIHSSRYRAFPIGIESPSHGQQQVLLNPADPTGSPYGWHDTDGVVGPEFTITRGNNVYALEDRAGNNGTDGYSPDGGAQLHFDFPLDLSLQPEAYEDAAITNLFVWNNYMHDLWYLYGFDEPAGNFQQLNYTSQGLGNDYVVADAQDGSGINNANFGTPPEGRNPRMQMFLWGVEIPADLTIQSPNSIAGTYGGILAAFSDPLASPLAGDLARGIDGTGNSTGCQVYVNAHEVNGKIAVIDRGNCSFVQKVVRAQDAGAIGVIVVNNVGTNEASTMGGSGNGIQIPAIMIGKADGQLIKNELADSTQAVNGSIAEKPPTVLAIDGDLDNVIIAHEYTHGISIRLTGGPSNTGCLSGDEQAGEGWSDWFGLVMSVLPGDVATTPRPVGTYALRQPTTGRGIRPAPYTTDRTLNDLTYGNIANGNISVPHGVGSVWCTMIWDLYWAFVDTYGYDPDIFRGTGGNNMVMQLVMDGLKLQPCNPGFVDSRDAILLADELNYGGANECLIWQVFADRGLGYSADQGSSASRSDGLEAFDLPPSCLPILYMEKSVSDIKISLEDTLRYTFEVFNQTPDSLFVLIQDSLPAGLQYVPNSGTCNTTFIQQELELTVGGMPDSTESICTIQAVVDRSITGGTRVITENDLEGSTAGFLISSSVGTDAWELTQKIPRSGKLGYFVPNAPRDNDQRLFVPPFTADDSTGFSFWHYFNTEAGWDGGKVEFRTDSLDWTDAGSLMIFNGYNGSVGRNNPSGSGGAFTGNSKLYVNTWIDFSDFAGQQVEVRFRFVSDNNTHVEGWYIDDIGVGKIATVFNTASVWVDSVEVWRADQEQQTVVFAEEPPLTTQLPNQFADFGAEVFPNPARESLFFQVSRAINAPVELRLINAAGQEVFQTQLPMLRANAPVDIQVEALPRGVYELLFRHGEQVENLKVIVQ